MWSRKTSVTREDRIGAGEASRLALKDRIHRREPTSKDKDRLARRDMLVALCVKWLPKWRVGLRRSVRGSHEVSDCDNAPVYGDGVAALEGDRPSSGIGVSVDADNLIGESVKGVTVSLSHRFVEQIGEVLTVVRTGTEVVR